MKKRVLVVALMLSAFFMMEMQAQTFSLKGEFRPRMEYRNGYKTLLPSKIVTEEGMVKISPAVFISQRSRLTFDYNSDALKVGFSLQNVGVWGESKTLSSSDINGIQVHEAWGQFKIAKGVELKVGRQAIVYDDQRIFGGVNWAQQGRSHDAAIFKFSPFGGKCKIDLGFAFNAKGESVVGQGYGLQYRTMQYLHYHRNFGNLGLSFLALNNGMPSAIIEKDGDDYLGTETIAFSQTIGTRFSYKIGKLKTNAAFYYQMGDLAKVTNINEEGNIEMKDVEVSAMYVGADVSYQLLDAFTAGLGFEYLSGTDDKYDEGVIIHSKTNTFNPLYGTNHKFNGWMDYFYVGFGNNTGLIDIYLPLKYKYKKATFNLTAHKFMAASTVMNLKIDETKEITPVTMDAALGTEFDFSFAYPISKNVIAKVGYSHMLPTETMKVLKNPAADLDRTSNWAWMMLVIKPTFFTSGK
jgi:hypothetical protein